MLNKILVAYDGSEQALKAFTWALNLAKTCNFPQPEIQLVAVVHPPEPADIVELDAMIDSATRHYEEQFQPLREQASALHIGIVTKVLVGHPAEQIIHYAKDLGIDMIFVGQTGKSKIETWLLGSVSKRIATHAHCTVTIVK